MNSRSRKMIFFWFYWIYNARNWKLLDKFEFRETLMKVLQINWMLTIIQISLWRVHFAQINTDWRKWMYSRIIVWLLVQVIKLRIFSKWREKGVINFCPVEFEVVLSYLLVLCYLFASSLLPGTGRYQVRLKQISFFLLVEIRHKVLWRKGE